MGTGSSQDKRPHALVMDEMRIKEDVVYNHHSGHIVGFTNIGEANEIMGITHERKILCGKLVGGINTSECSHNNRDAVQEQVGEIHTSECSHNNRDTV